jgi:RecA-family ATPase
MLEVEKLISEGAHENNKINEDDYKNQFKHLNNIEVDKGPIRKHNQLEIIENADIGLILSKLYASKVFYGEKIEEITPCIKVLGANNESFRLATYGNISVITGQAKSRKSFFVQCIVSAYAQPNKRALELIDANVKEDKKNILYFDTEQDKFDVSTLQNRIIAMSEMEPENEQHLEIFNLRKYPPLERFEIIEIAIQRTPNLGLVIIDGVKDLITNINDPIQATEITSALMKWSEEKDCHILTVIHENKGSEHARGHIGTELINKAETVISIRKQDENSKRSEVIPTYTRGKDFKPFAFTINEVGIPILDKEYKAITKGAPTKFSIEGLKTDQLDRVIKLIFKLEKELSYSDLLPKISFAINEVLGLKVGTNKLKEFITYLREKELIVKIDEKNSKSKFKSNIK